MIQKKEVRLVAVSISVEKLEGGMYAKTPKGKIIEISELDVIDQRKAVESGCAPIWRPVKLYFVSDDEIQSYDTVLLPSGEVKVMSNHDILDYLGSQSSATKKVIAMPEQIGYVVNRPPYESALSKFLFKPISVEHISEIMFNNGQCWIEMDDSKIVRLIEGKAVIHINNEQ